MKSLSIIFVSGLILLASCSKKGQDYTCTCHFHPTAIADSTAVFKYDNTTQDNAKSKCESQQTDYKATYGHYGMNGTYCEM